MTDRSELHPFTAALLAPVEEPIAVDPTHQTIGASVPDAAHEERFRILKIAPTAFFADTGCHVRIYEEAVALQRLGNEVLVCSYASGDDPPDVTVRRAPSLGFSRNPTVGSSLRKVLFDPVLALTAWRAVQDFRPDVIHAHLHEGALIGWLTRMFRNIPLVFDFQGSMTSEMVDHRFIRREGRWYGPLRRLERFINGRPDAIVTSSRNAADVLTFDFDYPRNKVYVMADAVDTRRFLPRWELPDMSIISELKEGLRLPLDRRIVVYLGLLAPYQGTDHLLEAAQILKQQGVPVHFLVMGYPSVDYYWGRAEEMGIQDMVTFTGRLPYPLAPEYLPLGDIGISPKLSETEGNGKLLNYMACGLPSIAFDTPVAREILGDLGIYAKLGSAASLAQAVRWMIENDDARMELARRLRERAVVRFDWLASARGMMELYGSLRT